MPKQKPFSMSRTSVTFFGYGGMINDRKWFIKNPDEMFGIFPVESDWQEVEVSVEAVILAELEKLTAGSDAVTQVHLAPQHAVVAFLGGMLNTGHEATVNEEARTVTLVGVQIGKQSYALVVHDSPDYGIQFMDDAGAVVS